MNIPNTIDVTLVNLDDPDINDNLHRLYKQWNDKLDRNLLRQQYYDMHVATQNLRIAVPPKLEHVAEIVGWPQKAVDALANRVVFDGFVTTGSQRDPLNLDGILDANDFAVELPLAVRSALIQSCSFVIVRRGDVTAGEPPIVISFRSAVQGTALWDAATRRVSCALFVNRVADKDDGSYPIDLTYLDERRTLHIRRDDLGRYQVVGDEANSLGHVPVYPLAYHRDASRPFGRSRISREVMSITDSAMRSMLRMEISAEFYSSPRAVLLGADPPVDKDGTPVSGWDAAVSHLLSVTSDGDGDKPSLQQLTQLSMQPHSDMIRTLAARMSGATSVPMSMFGVMTDSGPSSADAINASQSELVIEAEATCASFGAQLRRMARDIVRLRDDEPHDDDEMLALQVNWRNPERPSLAAVSDAVCKQINAIPWIAQSAVALERMGYTDSEITRLLADKRRSEATQTVSDLLDRLTHTEGGDTDADQSADRPAQPEPNGTEPTGGRRVPTPLEVRPTVGQ